MDTKFAPVKSLVDAPFFSELSKFKLENAKLEAGEVNCCGLMSVPVPANRHPVLRLSSESFNQDSASPVKSEFQIPGKLLNTNTIEEFKDVNKIELLQSRVELLGRQIADGSAIASPALLNQFYLLTFADLKKYKYYYWFMFPAFKWASRVRPTELFSASARLDEIMASLDEPVCILVEDLETTKAFKHLTKMDRVILGLVDFGSVGSDLPWHLRNIAAVLQHNEIETAFVYIYRRSGSSRWIELEVGHLNDAEWSGKGSEGWERNAQNRLVPKFTDLSSLMNPLDLADQAIDLNLKLMKWRAAPQIDLGAISSSKCLLLGAGTLGSYIARGLMAWGVRNITFIDSGKVSYSNPVRQPLYTHSDCVDQAAKAEAAAAALEKIFPGVNSRGIQLEIPMSGHPITNEERQHKEYEQLVKEIGDHDVVFLLMDSRESRWLPTVICEALNKRVVNVALGFDSFLVMRHGMNHNLGCYFCNDVVAPADSISRQTLDQMCTVTRPGCAMIASGHAVELFAQMAQVPDLAVAEAGMETVLGPMPHQLRGFLKTQETVKIWGPAFPSCSACGPSAELWKRDGWEFVKQALNDPMYVTEASGLGELQRKTEELELDSDSEGELI